MSVSEAASGGFEAKPPPLRGADYAELDFTTAAPGGVARRCLRLVLTCLLVHYLLWVFFVVFALVALVLLAGGSLQLATAAVALAALLYLPSYCDGSERRPGGRPWPQFRLMAAFRLVHEYARLRLVRTVKLPPGRPYVFGWHPHGILILSRLATYGGAWETLFPGVETRALGASAVFGWPGSREISLWLGAVDASPPVARSVLASGRSAIVYPGGSKEIFRTDMHSRETVLDLAARPGFVRLAMQFGAPLVPVVVYGERAAFSRLDPPGWLRDFCLRRCRLPVLCFCGRCCLLPHRGASLSVVVGAPLAVEHVPDIGKDDARVAATHQRYMAALRALWEAHKREHGYAAEDVLVIA